MSVLARSRSVRLVGKTLSILAVMCTAEAARADDPADLEAVLEQHVVTTASHIAETKAAAPATTSVITAEDIRRHGIRSLNEALNYLALGMFTTNPLHGLEIGARGVLMTADYGNHVLLLVDGHAVNEPYGGSASFDRGLGVPIELIDHVEVVLGPGAVLYGSNAMLGVVNVVTKRASDHRGVNLVLDSELATWGKIGAGAGTTFELLGRRLELTAQVEHQEQRGPSFTFAPQEYGDDSVTGAPKRFSPAPDGTGVWGGTARRSHYSRAPSAYVRLVSGNLEIALKASSYQRAAPYIDALVNPYGNFDDPSNYELERWLSANIAYRVPLSSRFEVKARLYGDLYTYDWYNRTSAAEDCFDGQLAGCRRHLGARSRWAGTELRGTYDWFRSGDLVTMLGTDARYETVVAGQQAKGLDGVGATASAGNVDIGNIRLGVYGQQTARPFSWLALNAGARLDVAEGYPAAGSPRASAAVTPWAAGTLKATYSTAFRAPSSWEREWADIYSLKAVDLRPERMKTVEASFEQQMGAHRVMFGVFRSTLSDLVMLGMLSEAEIAAAQAAGAGIADSFVGQLRNGGHIHSHGYNASLDGVLLGRRLRYGLNLTGSSSRQSDDGEDHLPTTVMPAFYGNARASYDLGDKLPTLAVAAQFAGRRPTDRAFDSGFVPMPYAPPTLELRGALTGPVPGVAGLSYRLTANYAFQPYGPYVIGPIQDGSFGVPAALSPVDRFRAGVGLQYVWDPS